MTPLNARLLEDRAQDVDPDLRFMALEDFLKYLHNPKDSGRSVSFFIPHLFRLLGDSAPAVQDHAVRTFPAIVRHISDAEVLQMVGDLFAAVGAARESRFAKSMPNLALRGIFKDSHARFPPPLARKTVDLLVPQLLAGPPSIDRVEIAHSLVSSLGFVLTPQELLVLVRASVVTAMSDAGVVGTESVAVVAACLKVYSGKNEKVRPESANDSLYDQTLRAILDYELAPARLRVFFSLLHAVLRSGRPLEPAPVFDRLVEMLQMDSLAQNDVDELDIDTLLAQNVARDGALVSLSLLVPTLAPESFVVYDSTLFKIVESFIAYDPLHDDDAAADSDPESDLEFSDDDDIEQFDDADENGLLAAKLRLHTVLLLRSVLASQPSALSLVLSEGLASRLFAAIADHADAVSEEAVAATVALIEMCVSPNSRSRAMSDVSMATDSAANNPLTVVSRQAEILENQVFSSLLVPKRITAFARTEELVRCLVAHFSSSLSNDFLSQLHQRLASLNLSLKTDSLVVRLYQVVLETYDIAAIPGPLLERMVQDLGDTLVESAPYSRALADIHSVCSILYRKVATSPEYVATVNSVFFPALAEKIGNRQYSGDRRTLLDSLCDLVVHIPLDAGNSEKCAEIFFESLRFELTVSVAIDCMIKMCNRKPELFQSPELFHRIMEKLTTYLASSDSTLYMCSLDLLKTLFKKTTHRGTSADVDALQNVLFALVKQSSEMYLLNNIFVVLGHTLATTKADEEFCVNIVNQVMNFRSDDVDDANTQPLEYLTAQLATNNLIGGERLYEIGLQNLTLKNFTSARFLASVAMKCSLTDAIRSIEQELLAGTASVEKIIFDIHFLGCVSAENELHDVSFDTFFSILNTHGNDQVRVAAARALGLCITRDFETHLPTLLSFYQSSSNDGEQKRALILVAIKQVLKQGTAKSNIRLLRTIWSTIFEAIASETDPLVHQDVAELKLAGDILSKITEIDAEQDYQQNLRHFLDSQSVDNCNEHLIYVIVVIVKQLLGLPRLETSLSDTEVSVGTVERVTEFLPRPNLELKSAIVSSLLTGAYNQYEPLAVIVNQVILPKVYDELAAKEVFRKVIPMGPYKYVVDEGLEVRKLSYEFISAIINVESDFDAEKMFEILSAKGLNDSENDIINLAIYNLTRLIDRDEAILQRISFHEELVASLTKVINRKLRSKASTQETESYEDTIRTVIKFSKRINDILVDSNAISNSWSTYYYELRNKHHLLFSTNQE